MGIDRYNYIGPYLKVWLPKIEYTHNIKTCSNISCKEYKKDLSKINFCPVCGRSVVESVITELTENNMHSYMQTNFGEDDTFSIVYMEFINCARSIKNFNIVISNYTVQGGLHTSNLGEYSLPNLSIDQFKVGDWDRLIKQLDKDQIEYETHMGYISYAQ